MTFLEALEEQEKLEQAVELASEKLRNYPTSANGLTPDNIKESIQFKCDKKVFEIAFQNLRIFNCFFVKQFKKELKAHRKLTRP